MTARENEVCVLFVDDDPFFRELGQETLNECGYEVVAVSGGREALEKIEANKFDLAIVDNEMPDVTGFQVIEQARQMANGCDLPIIVVTGSCDPDTIDRAYQIGADSFLAKPFDWSLLVHHANFVMKSARTALELRQAVKGHEMMRTIQERFVQTLVMEAQKPLKDAVNFARIMHSEADGPLGSDYYRSCVDEIFTAMDHVNATFVKLIHRGDLGAQVAELDENEHSLKNFITEIEHWARRECHRNDCGLVSEVRIPAIVRMMCDRVLLVQAIKNMVHNAIDLSPRGSEISFSAEFDHENGLCIFIDDKAPTRIVGNGDHEKIGDGRGSPQTLKLPLSLQTSNIVIGAHGGKLRLNHTPSGGRIELNLPPKRFVPAQQNRQTDKTSKQEEHADNNESAIIC